MSVNLPIVFHFHQPVDNFDHVIEEIYDICYKPLLDRIDASNVKCTLHFTGSMLDWFKLKHPEFLDKVQKLCTMKRVELISGGYYEPIIPLLPDDDKIGQIKLLNETIKEEFGFQPVGMWLAERVWEPQLPKFIARSNLKYIIVDDNHFKACGFSEEETFHYYTTEEDGHTINVFQINEPLRYLAPWQPVQRLVEYLVKVKNPAGDRIVLFMSDAEKMGAWGTTHQLCYKSGHDGERPYIEELFDKIEEHSWINSITLSECLNKFNSKGLIYLGNASYDKMEEWVLPTPIRRKMEIIKEKLNFGELNILKELDVERFIKGGFWRYFLVKYPESNNMHKKMLHVSKKLSLFIEKFGNHKKIQIIKQELYKSQANDCYWHGQFGGIYLNFLRHSVYKHAIEAEKLIEQLFTEKEKPITPNIIKTDFLKTGREQILVETPKLNVYINPWDGGTVFELDYKDLSYNLMNLLSRWKEAYHFGGNKEQLVFDEVRKIAGRNLLFRKPFSMENFISGKCIPEFGWKDNLYNIVQMDNREGEIRIRLDKANKLDNGTLTISKNYIIDINKPNIEFEVINEGPIEIFNQFEFVVEFPLFFNGNPKEFIAKWNNEAKNPLDGIEALTRSIDFIDRSYNLKVNMIFNELTRVYTYSHETFSRMNTDDYQSKYQGVGILLHLNNPSLKMSINITSIS